MKYLVQFDIGDSSFFCSVNAIDKTDAIRNTQKHLQNVGIQEARIQHAQRLPESYASASAEQAREMLSKLLQTLNLTFF